MTTDESNTIYEIVERALYMLKFNNVKRWVEYQNKVYTITAIEVYCSPLLMSEKIKLLKRILPSFNITGNTNQSYILIKRNDNITKG